jgi:hypothetical protein
LPSAGDLKLAYDQTIAKIERQRRRELSSTAMPGKFEMPSSSPFLAHLGIPAGRSSANIILTSHWFARTLHQESRRSTCWPLGRAVARPR